MYEEDRKAKSDSQYNMNLDRLVEENYQKKQSKKIENGINLNKIVALLCNEDTKEFKDMTQEELEKIKLNLENELKKPLIATHILYSSFRFEANKTIKEINEILKSRDVKLIPFFNGRKKRAILRRIKKIPIFISDLNGRVIKEWI